MSMFHGITDLGVIIRLKMISSNNGESNRNIVVKGCSLIASTNPRSPPKISSLNYLHLRSTTMFMLSVRTSKKPSSISLILILSS